MRAEPQTRKRRTVATETGVGWRRGSRLAADKEGGDRPAGRLGATPREPSGPSEGARLGGYLCVRGDLWTRRPRAPAFPADPVGG